MNKMSIKDKKINLTLNNKNLIDAAGFALIEALRWSDAAEILRKHKNLNMQFCVNALFSIELFMKSILLSNNIDVKEKKFKHDIYKLFNELEVDIKDKIKKDVKYDTKSISDLLGNIVNFASFEEELEFISNDFMYLRYEYEKFLNGYSIFTFSEFVSNLMICIRELSLQIVAKNIRLKDSQ